jgi:hypothetical protein
MNGVGEGRSSSASAGPEVHISSVLPPSYSLDSQLQNPAQVPSLFVSFLAALRSHDTMTTINLDSVKFYHPLSMTGMTDKNPMVTLQHKGETAEDTQDGVAGM